MVSATIDTSALRHNLNAVRKRAPGSRVMAVVKANAYGHGLVAVARALDAADAFAVARVDEGLVLRRAGIVKPIVLLEGVFDSAQLAAAAASDFELVVHAPEQIELLRADGAHAFKVWLKMDTGMNRLGLKEAQFAAAHAALAALPGVRRPVNAFTHLASADEPARDSTMRQLARFAAGTGFVAGERSIANSAGLLNFPAALADWVRPGLMLYGVSPMAGATGADHGLKPVMTLRSRIIAVKCIDPGDQVGYGGAWTATRPTRLAVAAVGYGDGYPRGIRAGAPVLVNERRAPLAGRVSMDMIGIDVTDVDPPVAAGDPVVLWGAGLAVEEVAANAGMIPYELLCGISQRVAAEVR
ncbi:MAG: alanine racemase [Gammaproteobacteria bacterium]|nr:alanine racemase [Gammaproteobacteria bacterium]MDE2349879.1 alanine racemase [Gammaproteobacteria bacterium]